MTRRAIILSMSVAVVLALKLSAASPPACDPDNGGLELPPGFCALVAADGLGYARHVVVAANGDVYVSIRGTRSASGGGVVALRDKDGDGRLETREMFGEGSDTGIALRNGYLYVSTSNSVFRYKMKPGELVPGPQETVVSELPLSRAHQEKTLAFDGKGSFYINIGAPSNACQEKDRQASIPGQDPCPLLATTGGIWKFNENRLNQKPSDGTRYATGLRQMPALTWHDNAVYIVMNNRDQLDTLWAGKFTAQENAERPAETMDRITEGKNFGWPYCFYDYGLKKLLVNPEYGGDGKDGGRCNQYELPIASYPAHWSPVDVMFYSGKQFPASYRGGAFIAFHGSYNRAPLPQAGYNITFQPFKNGKPSGDFQIFASGFAGKSPVMSPAEAKARPDGVGQAQDGSLYITDSVKGKLWRVFYRGEK